LNDKIISKSEINKLINKFEKSLSRLNLSSCYGLLIHQEEDIFKEGNEYLIETINELKIKGLVKKIGISLYKSDDIIKIIEKAKPDIIQLPLNVLDQRFIQDGSLKYLKNNNIEVHARSVFLQGLLLMPSKKIPIYFKKWFHILDEWKKICFENNINNLDAALNFVLKQNYVDYCLIGIENLEQLENCIFASKNRQILDFSKLACKDKDLLNPFNWKI
jgi:aryl-alcohol dehydrogenase-like predicted oxidoreductase